MKRKWILPHLLATLLSGIGFLGLHAFSATDDDHWESGFVLPPGVNGQVYASVVLGRDLFIGGPFSIAGTNEIRYLARWDGTNWYSVGGGVDGPVFALAVQRKLLIVAGQFTSAGPVTATNIAQWSGQSWETLGNGVSGTYGRFTGGPAIWSLAVSGNFIYAGGQFQTAGNVRATNIAKWNGTQWSSLRGGIDGAQPEWFPPEQDGSVVYALAARGPKLYAGGMFARAGGVFTTNIAYWNGRAWHALRSGVSDGSTSYIVGDETRSGVVYGLGFHRGRLLVGGDFQRVGRFNVRNFAEWSGTDWVCPRASFDGDVNRFLSSGDVLYVGGRFTTINKTTVQHIARGNGSSWSKLGEGLSGQVITLTGMGRTIYAGGAFGVAGDTSASGIARWDGKRWSALGNGTGNSIMGDDRAIVAAGVSTFYVAGQIHTAGTNRVGNIAKWDGTNWSGLGNGISGFIRKTATIGSDLFVAGAFVMPDVGATNLAKWNGTNWSAVGGYTPNAGTTYFGLTDDMVAGGSNLYLYNSELGFTYPLTFPHLVRWDGSNWSTLPHPPSSGPQLFVLMLAANEQYLYASLHVPVFAPLGNETRIKKWDGYAWSDVGGQLRNINSTEGRITAMLANGNELYIAGEFIGIGDVAVTNLARWDGSTWSSLGGAFDSSSGQVSSLALSGDKLFIAGSFNTIGGVSANNIARWDGQNWSPLGSGLINESAATSGGTYVSGLAASGGQVCAVGDFTSAGSKPSYHFAIWDEPQ